MAEILGAAASVITVVEVAGKVWSVCWRYYDGVKNAQVEMRHLMDSITALQMLFQHVQDSANTPAGAAKLKASKQLLERISSELTQEFNQLLEILKPGLKNKGKKLLLRQKLKWPLQSKDMEKTLQLLDRHKTTLNTAMSFDQMTAVVEISNQVEATNQAIESRRQHANLLMIPRAKGAVHNHRLWEHEQHCLQDTRVALRQQIIEWCDNPDSECIFWLNGRAGTGKSTISRTIALKLATEKRLAASFFFSRGQADISHANMFFTTIAAQLADSLPVLRSSISKAIDTHSDIFELGLREQWKHLILNPLKNAPAQSVQLVVVIDALDECDSQQDIQLILQLLAEAKDLGTIRLRIFVTSRPDAPILDGFSMLSGETYQDFVLHNIQPSTVNRDISVFFQQKLSSAKHKPSTPWPDEPTIQLLVEKAAGLFIYAATTCRFIIQDGYDPNEQLSIILTEGTHSESPTEALDDMYTTLLRHSIIGKRNVSLFRQIVGSIVIMSDVMPAKNLARLLDISDINVLGTLGSLHSVLNVPNPGNANDREPVRIFHPSFRDFLLDSERCSDSKFQIDTKEAHTILFRNCMKLIFELHENLCHLPELGILVGDISKEIVQQNIPAHVQYACRYWVYHLQHGNPIQEDIDRILLFLKQHFLHWLEALSLIKEVSNGVSMIRTLEELLVGNLGAYPELVELVYDAKRFILHNKSIIETAPLQVYYTGLFTPETSLIRKQYFHVPWIGEELKVISNWGPMIQTLEGHSAWVISVVFSPDGKLLVSASHDKTIRLWETSTGKQCSILEGHSENVNSVAFSPDGKLLASASSDKTARLWETSTGKQSNVLEGHSDYVNSVVFSPDGKLLASASWGKTVMLWETSTGNQRSILEGHSASIHLVVFSPDGKLLASASHDKTIRLWETPTGKQRNTLKDHSNYINSIVFSPDGKLLVSASDDKTVMLWETSTGNQRSILKGHSASVNSVVFSPDGKLLASASNDKTVRLWETSTGKQCSILEGHSEYVRSVVFSPDGKLLASFNDKTVRLWDTLIGKCSILEGHLDPVKSVAFSPDGKLLASASSDHTVRLWETSTGPTVVSPDGKLLAHASVPATVRLSGGATSAETQRSVLEGHSACVNSIVLSPDRKLLASASSDHTIRLWDTSTGKQCSVLEGHSDYINPVVFSPDGKLLASASYDKTSRLWEIPTGKQYSILEGHSSILTAVAFSPDGKLLASASFDNTIRLWETSTTGKQCRILEGHFDAVMSVIFSPNGKFLASTSFDRTVRLWETSTGKQYSILKSNSNILSSVAFSPDGKLLASSDGTTVRLWETSTGKQCSALEGHSDYVRSVAFSPDGKVLASASRDHIVRLWDTTKNTTSGAIDVIDVGHSVQIIEISNDGTHIKTDRGPIRRLQNSIRGSNPELVTTPCLFIEQQWIKCNMKKLLLLPLAYSPGPDSTAVVDNLVVMGCSNGQVLFLSFDFTALPPIYLELSSDTPTSFVTGTAPYPAPFRALMN